MKTTIDQIKAECQRVFEFDKRPDDVGAWNKYDGEDDASFESAKLFRTFSPAAARALLEAIKWMQIHLGDDFAGSKCEAWIIAAWEGEK